jgi:hypothetical protein
VLSYMTVSPLSHNGQTDHTHGPDQAGYSYPPLDSNILVLPSYNIIHNIPIL